MPGSMGHSVGSKLIPARMLVNPFNSNGKLRAVAQRDKITVLFVQYHIGYSRSIKCHYRSSTGKAFQSCISHTFLERRKQKYISKAVIGSKLLFIIRSEEHTSELKSLMRNT